MPKLKRLKLEELKEEATARKIAFTEDVERKVLVKAIEDYDKVDALETKNTEAPKNEPKGSGGKKVFYWLKTTAYVDPERRLPAGLYQLDNNKRLNGADPLYVERFEGKIPERALVIIAEKLGIKFNASDDVDFDELFEKLLNPPVYF